MEPEEINQRKGFNEFLHLIPLDSHEDDVLIDDHHTEKEYWMKSI